MQNILVEPEIKIDHVLVEKGFWKGVNWKKLLPKLILLNYAKRFKKH